MSGFCVADFKCPDCGEIFEKVYYKDATIMECPFCDDIVMERCGD